MPSEIILDKKDTENYYRLLALLKMAEDTTTYTFMNSMYGKKEKAYIRFLKAKDRMWDTLNKKYELGFTGQHGITKNDRNQFIIKEGIEE